MAERPYTVVVGVSATSKSPTALAWARAQAGTEGKVVAVRAWRLPNPQATPSGTPAGRISRADEVEEEARAALEHDVTETLGEDHGVELRLERGSKFNVLLQAELMFAHRLVYAASCPVVVMPPEISGEPPSVLSRVGRAVGRNVLAAAGTAGRPGYQRPVSR
jgi:hypothetical protein